MRAELIQHAAEIRMGMNAGDMAGGGREVRIGFGLAKIVVVIGTLVLSWRLWRHDGEIRRALRPTGLLFRGIALFLLTQMLGDGAALGLGRGLVVLAGSPAGSIRSVLTIAPLLAWLLASAALYPWYVGLAIEDRTMTLRRTVRGMPDRLPPIWILLFAGVLPMMIVHYMMSYAAMAGAPLWPLMAADAIVVGMLTAAVAATL